MSSSRRTNIYVDGFNLYYRALKRSPYKWLDLFALCSRLLDETNDIRRIRYFTARVKPSPMNPDVHVRQEMYLRALRTIPCVDIHFGHFLQRKAFMPLASPLGSTTMARVLRTEEKGSDVALASHLLVDGFKGDYDVAVVISNDSDLAPPIELAREHLGLAIGVITPERGSSKSQELKRVASFFRTLSVESLAASQFPSILRDDVGEFAKPDRW